VHGKAESNYWGNDSVFVQFSGSVTSSGSSTYRIGSTSSTEMNLEDCSGCGLSGWKWQDNGYGSGILGPVIYFNTTGTHTLRIQTREDGLSIDQIILSPTTYLSKAPTTTLTTTTATTTTTTSPTTTTTSPTTTTTSPTPTTTTTTTTGNILKVLDWNIHHGTDQNSVCALALQADWIVKTGANVVSLNEVEKNKGWCNNEDQVARMVSLLQQKTGKTWYYNFATLLGGTSGQGNLLLSTFPIESSGDYLLSYNTSVARIAILVNGIRVNVFSTHLDANSSAYRATQMREMTTWAATYPEQRILTGDFNAWPGAGEITNMTSGHYDAWAEGVKTGISTAFAGNEAGNTRNSRIDYVFFSKAASRLVLKAVRVFDTRNASGVMASDHRPLMATFEVR
jgi:endonuclease/exonuclease/phosphatase family metal-dependent hydrolase